MYIGKDMQGDKRRTWMNGRGFQVGLNVGNKFTLNTSAFENQAVFPKYLDDYIVAHKVIPGQGNTKFQSKNKMDWMYATASMTYDAHNISRQLWLTTKTLSGMAIDRCFYRIFLQTMRI
jgi:hypothetical protein